MHPAALPLALGRGIAAARGQDFAKEAVFGREGITGVRPADKIGVMAAAGRRRGRRPYRDLRRTGRAARADPSRAEPRVAGARRAARRGLAAETAARSLLDA